jgi:hypothetical protein
VPYTLICAIKIIQICFHPNSLFSGNSYETITYKDIRGQAGLSLFKNIPAPGKPVKACKTGAGPCKEQFIAVLPLIRTIFAARKKVVVVECR